MYGSFTAILGLLLVSIDVLSEKTISLQNEILIKQAQTHFKEQVNIRKWASQYSGVYVKPINGLKANIYLEDNTLQTADGETLIKINPAWMTRQLSELSDIEGYQFRITGINPINPNNKADVFELRALKYFEDTKNLEYFEIKNNSDFRYMGALITTKDCLGCHAHEGYRLGDIQGGLSIRLDTLEHNEIIDLIKSRALLIKFIITLLVLSIAFLIHRQMRHNERLEEEVDKQTKQIKTTKKLLQEVLDTDKSFLMVTDAERLIFANKTMLDFFEVQSIEDFFLKYERISNLFIENNDDESLSARMDEEHWVTYLHREQERKKLKVFMKNKDNDIRCFRPHSKEFNIDIQNLNIIIFNDITDELEKISTLEEKASTDALTGLFNKGKFHEVITKEISLAESTKTPLSLVFLDMDHFKVINDTYGHDIGDHILKTLASILQETVRKGDFLARWGGEEFVVTLQATEVEEAVILAEKIRKNIEAYNFENAGKQTVSLGVTQYISDESEGEFIKRVDKALYEAKERGRNKVVMK